MTEDEAKTKWCHAFTASHTDPRAREFDGDAPDLKGGFQHHCIGSACMAWREDRLRGGAMLGMGAEVIGGHCGLAGPVQS